MFNDKEDEPHLPTEEGSYIEFRVDFKQDDEGDESDYTVAAVHTHLHNAPTGPVIDSLLMIVKGIIAQNSTEMVRLPDGAPEVIRSLMLDAFATMMLKQRLDSLGGTTLESVSIPNDASELFE